MPQPVKKHRYKNGEKVFVGYYANFYDPEQRPPTRSVSLKTRDLDTARKRLVQMERDYALGVWDPWARRRRREVTMGKAVEEALRDRWANVRPRTRKEVGYVLNALAEFVGRERPVSALRSSHLAEWISDPDVKRGTRQKRYNAAKAFTEWAQGQGGLSGGIMDGIERPGDSPGRLVYATPGEVRRLEQEARARGRDWLADIVVFLAHTGFRRGEALALRWRSVDFGGRFVRVENYPSTEWGRGEVDPGFTVKDGDERAVPLSRECARVLANRYAVRGSRDATVRRRDLVFANASGGLLKGRYLLAAFRKTAAQAGLRPELTPHSLRHGYGTRLIADPNVPAYFVKQAMGHSRIRTTERYVHAVAAEYGPVILQALDK